MGLSWITRRICDQVGVQHSDHAARCPLRRKVVDARDLDVVDDGEVLDGAAAAYDEVVALIGLNAGARQHLQHPADVARSPGAATGRSNT